MIKINGLDPATLGLTFVSGFLEQMLSFAPSKPAITNTSRHINGVEMHAKNAKVNSRTVSIPVHLKGSSEDDFLNKLEALEALLRNGKQGTGITELFYKRYTYKLRFDSCEPLRIFVNEARLMLTFTEPNPADR